MCFYINFKVRLKSERQTDRQTVVLLNNPKLVKLDITRCTSLTNNCILKLINCKNIMEVVLHACHWLHPDPLSQMLWLRGLTVQSLDLKGCLEVNDVTVSTIANCCPNLQYFTLAQLENLTDSSIIMVARCCRKLRYLNIQYCRKITHEAMKYLGEYCTDLRMLQIQQCNCITEISLARLRSLGVKTDVMIKQRPLKKSHLEFFKSLKIQK